VLHPVFANVLSLGFLAFEAQQVIAMRMMRLAAGGALADREVERMVSEKSLALVQAGMGAAASMMLGRSGTVIARGGIRHYRKRVRANRRRLTRT
jgi:hypothetical protein